MNECQRFSRERAPLRIWGGCRDRHPLLHGTALARIEHELTKWIAEAAALPEPAQGRLSRQSRHFPVAPAVALQPDERGRHFLLSITATDRVGLLYAVARVLAQHHVNVQTAKILTLGERVEDVFLLDSGALAQPREQLQLESDLLAVLKP